MSQGDHKETLTGIMNRIHDEDPSFWPYGLSMRHLDGGAWLVRKSATLEPIGFLGWQERSENMKKIGYYAVGILPEFRGKGFAKQAVASLLAEKAPTVDNVRAMIADHNAPSLALASALGVPVKLVKSAGVWPAVKGFAKNPWTLSTLGALGYDAAIEQKTQHAENPGGGFDAGKWLSGLAPQNDGLRTIMLGLNTGLMRTGAPLMKNPATVPLGMGILGSIPAKDMLLQGLGVLPVIGQAAGRHALPTDAGTQGMGTGAKVALGTGAAALAALLGSSIYNGNRQTKAAEEAVQREQGGKIRVTLPTKNPGDQETQLEMPINNVSFSNALMQNLHRDIRRRLRTETAARTYRRVAGGGSTPTIAY